MKTPTVEGKPSGLQLAALHLLHLRLQECREAAPGAGGDVDTMNVRFMIKKKEWSQSAVNQAVGTLVSFAATINEIAQVERINPADAVEAIRQATAYPDLMRVAEKALAAIEDEEQNAIDAGSHSEAKVFASLASELSVEIAKVKGEL